MLLNFHPPLSPLVLCPTLPLQASSSSLISATGAVTHTLLLSPSFPSLTYPPSYVSLHLPLTCPSSTSGSKIFDLVPSCRPPHRHLLSLLLLTNTLLRAPWRPSPGYPPLLHCLPSPHSPASSPLMVQWCLLHPTLLSLTGWPWGHCRLPSLSLLAFPSLATHFPLCMQKYVYALIIALLCILYPPTSPADPTPCPNLNPTLSLITSMLLTSSLPCPPPPLPRSCFCMPTQHVPCAAGSLTYTPDSPPPFPLSLLMSVRTLLTHPLQHWPMHTLIVLSHLPNRSSYLLSPSLYHPSVLFHPSLGFIESDVSKLVDTLLCSLCACQADFRPSQVTLRPLYDSHSRQSIATLALPLPTLLRYSSMPTRLSWTCLMSASVRWMTQTPCALPAVQPWQLLTTCLLPVHPMLPFELLMAMMCSLRSLISCAMLSVHCMTSCLMLPTACLRMELSRHNTSHGSTWAWSPQYTMLLVLPCLPVLRVMSLMLGIPTPSVLLVTYGVRITVTSMHAPLFLLCFLTSLYLFSCPIISSSFSSYYVAALLLS